MSRIELANKKVVNQLGQLGYIIVERATLDILTTYTLVNVYITYISKNSYLLTTYSKI